MFATLRYATGDNMPGPEARGTVADKKREK
jgi:hypothetical protein